MTTHPPDDRYLVAHIRERLAQDPRANVLDVEVEAQGRTLILSGPVASQQRRAAIGSVVRELAPDYEMVDRMTLVGERAPAQPEDVE